MRGNATTTPELRAYVRASDKSVGELAKELRVSRTTIYRWRGRTTVNDASRVPPRPTSSLSEAEERLVCELRTRARLPIDDIADIMCRCVNGQLSRSAIYRSLRRNGLNRVPDGGDVTANGLDRTDAGLASTGLEHLLARPHADSPGQPNRDDVTPDGPSILKLALVDLRAIGGTSIIVGVVDPKPETESVVEGPGERLGDRTDDTTSHQPVQGSAGERLASQAGDDHVSHGPGVVADDPCTEPDPGDSSSATEPDTPAPAEQIGASVAAEPQDSRPRSRSSLGRYALTLWLAGAVAYVAGTQTFLGALDTFSQKGGGEAKTAVSSASLDSALRAASAKQAGSVSAPTKPDPAAAGGGEWVEISDAGVNMRAGPSSKNQIVTVQSLGMKLRVLSRDGKWTEVIDPETRQKGWVFQRYIKPSVPP